MKPLFEHFLCPYNGTQESKKAFRKAVKMAEAFDVKITVLTCIEQKQTFGFFKTKSNKQEFEKERKMVEKEHDELFNYASKYGVKVISKIIKSSMASHEILDFAKMNNVDLIIMSKRKFSVSAERKLHWSTLENVMRHTSKSVLIIQ